MRKSSRVDAFILGPGVRRHKTRAGEEIDRRMPTISSRSRASDERGEQGSSGRCGDFNSVRQRRYREMNAAFHPFPPTPRRTRTSRPIHATIDYIFVSDGVRVVSVQEQPATPLAKAFNAGQGDRCPSSPSWPSTDSHDSASSR